MKTYLENLDFKTITESETLIQVLQAQVNITNSTSIYDSTSIIYSFSSTVLIENTLMFEIGFAQSPMNMISTTATLSNLTIAN